MSEISKILDQLYTNFLLRDIVAKIIPGLLLATSFILLLIDKNPIEFKWLEDVHPFAGIAFLYGFGMMLGMLCQFIGYRWPPCCLRIRIYVWPKGGRGDEMEASLEKLIAFAKTTTCRPKLARKRERLLILKEMAGNYSVVCFLTVIFIIVRIVLNCTGVLHDGPGCVFAAQPNTCYYLVLGTVTCILLGLILLKQNHLLAEEQRLWEEKVLSQYTSRQLTKV